MKTSNRRRYNIKRILLCRLVKKSLDVFSSEHIRQMKILLLWMSFQECLGNIIISMKMLFLHVPMLILGDEQMGNYKTEGK